MIQFYNILLFLLENKTKRKTNPPQIYKHIWAPGKAAMFIFSSLNRLGYVHLSSKHIIVGYEEPWKDFEEGRHGLFCVFVRLLKLMSDKMQPGEPLRISGEVYEWWCWGQSLGSGQRDGQMGETPEEPHWREKTGMVEGALGGSARSYFRSYPFFVVLFCHLSLVFLSCKRRIPVPSVPSLPHPPPPTLLWGPKEALCVEGP